METFKYNIVLHIELLYSDTVIFETKSKNRNFLKSKLKGICFSTLKSYSFDEVEKYLKEAESIALTNLIKRKDLVIQKADKGNTVVITDRTKYLEGVKSLLSNNSRFMQLPINEGKWLNYIINLESKLEDRFKVLKNEEKKSKKEFDNICPVGTTFLCHYEKICLNECPSQFKPAVYRRYLDDIFVLFTSKEYLKLFVNYMKSKHKNVKFTFGTEDSNNF